MRKCLLLLLLLAALCAARCAAWAEVLKMPAGALLTVDLSRGTREYRFVPGSGSVYDICVFPVGKPSAVKTALYEGDTLLAESGDTLTAISERLTAGAAYTLKLTGGGVVRLEVARHALSRCFEMPMALAPDGDSYAKAIAKPGDVHWYAVTAASDNPVVLAGLPDAPALYLEAKLFDSAGHLLMEAARTAGGAFLMDYIPVPNAEYRIRISASGGGTGLYSLMTAQGEGGLPEALELSETDLHINGRETRPLAARLSPRGSLNATLWESSDPSVARVSQNGDVTGAEPGTAMVTAYGAGGVYARCRVEVRRVPVKGLTLNTNDIELNAGDAIDLQWSVIPENATEPRVYFALDPAEGIATVDAAGTLTALEEGSATLTVQTLDGGFEASTEITIRPAPMRCRALLIGEQNYAATLASTRQGSANSVAGMRSMLNHLSGGGSRFEVTTALDVSRDGALKAIRDAFDGAADGDMALLYITCHGYYADGMTCLQMYDGSILTAQELRCALDQVPGQIVLLADFCGSGGFIARAGTPDDILSGIDAVFGGTIGASLFSGSRYRVLASASIEQDSYRIGFERREGESAMATVFARALCEGCGWHIGRAARGALLADYDADGAVSLNELYRYTARRVEHYLSLGGGSYVQTVRVSPEGDTAALFVRPGG